MDVTSRREIEGSRSRNPLLCFLSTFPDVSGSGYRVSVENLLFVFFLFRAGQPHSEKRMFSTLFETIFIVLSREFLLRMFFFSLINVKTQRLASFCYPYP